jgi:hypothetical protein
MKRIKKLIIGAAAVALCGAAYCAKVTNYRHIGDAVRIADEVVVHQKEYEQTLLEELSFTDSEQTANEMIEQGSLARKRINIWKSPADDFTQNPYDLRIVIEHTPEGERAYLADLKTGERLPIFRNNQVGDFNHRISGMYEITERTINQIFEEAKTTTLHTIDSFLKGLEEQK